MSRANDMAPGAARPKVSVITVVFNGRDYVEPTLRSVLEQTYPDIEYIVVDGGSTDGTVDIIRQYEQGISRWSSERDKGIYDAMNKGLATATGRWVIFMNAGDAFYAPTTVEEIFGGAVHEADIVYGGVEIQYPGFSRIQQPGAPERLWQGMQFSHQSVFVDVRRHQERPYNAANRIAADLQFFYESLHAGLRFKRLDQVVARVSTGGLSEVNRVKAIKASCDAVCGGRIRPLVRLYYFGRIVDAGLRSLAKRLLPDSAVVRAIRRKERRQDRRT
ncbi:glycosyltransferase family 2 protein [Herbaspirillum chlorophenolicum]|uniref:Glycosyltransferase family 2 protein n=1 Tax=Herbaspirillum chlorophenolicum TaxID=211589 RepID=A0ABW8ETZ8_9BURK